MARDILFAFRGDTVVMSVLRLCQVSFVFLVRSGHIRERRGEREYPARREQGVLPKAVPLQSWE